MFSFIYTITVAILAQGPQDVSFLRVKICPVMEKKNELCYDHFSTEECVFGQIGCCLKEHLVSREALMRSHRQEVAFQLCREHATEGRCGGNCGMPHTVSPEVFEKMNGIALEFPRATPECWYYKHGFCKFGAACVNAHKIYQRGVGSEPCTFFVRGFCMRGDMCQYLHDPERQRVGPSLCWHYVKGWCKLGSECHFSHDTERHRVGPSL